MLLELSVGFIFFISTRSQDYQYSNVQLSDKDALIMLLEFN